MFLTTCSNDNTVGSTIYSCRDGFDFTLEFEELFFSIIPAAVFILLSSWRLVLISRSPIIVEASLLQWAKLSCIAIYVGLSLAILVFAALRSSSLTNVAVASAALPLIAGISMLTLSYFDHTRSPKPSALLNTYLALTILFDAAQVRTLWLASSQDSARAFSSIFTASVATKVLILVLEVRQKTRWVRWNDSKEHSPEETSGIFNLGVYSWLNTLFVRGYRRVLRDRDLFPLDKALDSETLQHRLSLHLSDSKLGDAEYGLAKTLVRTLFIPLLLPIPARLGLIGFTFCQPFFINSMLDYLSAAPNSESDNFGYGYIGASFLIYSGIAVSTALYWYFHHRMLYMVRGTLVTAIYKKATERRLEVGNDHTASVTLMSADIERINIAFRNLHEFWANAIEIALASWLLYRQLGGAFAAPVVIVLCCAAVLSLLAKYVGPAQRAWMSMVQKRVSVTANVISGMKNLKISGLVTPVAEAVQKMRVDELKASSKARGLSLTAAVIAYVPLMVSPFMTFAVAHQNMDAAKLYTSLSYLTLLATPLLSVFQSIPQVVAGLACLGRIQAFLEAESHEDFRTTPGKAVWHHGDATRNVEMSTFDRRSTAITISNGSFGWEPGKMVLRDINLEIPWSALTIVVGPVASGKSTLCKALLGEIPYHHGHVKLGSQISRVGYCDQAPFLQNSTIKEIILGFSAFDPVRYAEVIYVTMLRLDLDTLPYGDNTRVGSNGVSLSGGQRQRVAMARALYLETDLFIFDDVFSGLDTGTEDQVFRRVFGQGGLLKRRKATAVLCTHSVRQLPKADHIIEVGVQGTVVEQGRLQDILPNSDYIQTAMATFTDDEGSAELREPKTVFFPQANSRSAPTAADGDSAKTRQNGDAAVYLHYIKSMGVSVATAMFVLGLLMGFFYNFPTVWLTYWSDDALSADPAHSYGFYVGIYALLETCFLFSFAAFGCIIFIVVMRRSGAQLHQDILRTLIRAPLRYLTTTDQGTITNLFSQDLNLIDTELLTAVLALFYSLFIVVGQAAVLFTSSLYIAISYPFLAALLYVLQKFYLKTSRQLRFLDLEAKSPLYTHFLDTSNGITTLRAFGFIKEDIDKNFQFLDTSQRPAYLLIMIQQWLTLVLNMVVMVMAVLLTILAVQLRSKAGFTGASLVTLMQFGENLSGIVMFYTLLETSIGAIARLRGFCKDVTPEGRATGEDVEPQEDWPQRGEIELRNVSATYDEPPDSGSEVEEVSSLALRNISLSIQAGEKVAICGRTGSGKSSLIALLLKLLDPLAACTPTSPAQSGDDGQNTNINTITIDGLSLEHLDRRVLRQRIIAVPQDAVLLPDGWSFRDNLAPCTAAEAATPGDCESVLRAVGLWDVVTARGGLEARMTAEALSQGQRQLFSLARAVLRGRVRRGRSAGQEGGGGGGGGGGLLLLDEVSASVDQVTERAMLEVIRREFKDYTVVAVSHRLDMIIDFDKVVVMDQGEIVEVGRPRELARSKETRFGELWALGGRVTKSTE